MASYTVRKIKEIPFRINQDVDKIIAKDLTRDQFEELLVELGYDLNKKKLIDGISVYYKNRRNGMYVSYVHKNSN